MNLKDAFRSPSYVGGNPSPVELLAWSYRYRRATQKPPRGKENRNQWGPREGYAKTAHALATNDAAAGKVRYESSARDHGYGPAFAARGGKAMRFIEKPSACGLRFVGYADKIIRLDHNGWFVDNDQSETVRGVVFQLPGRNGVPLFVAGYEDWNNSKADSDGPVCLDFAEVVAGERPEWVVSAGYWSCSDSAADHDGAHTAARYADQIAEWLAEDEREYNAAWQAGSRYSDVADEIASDRKEALRLLSERRAAAKAVGTSDQFNTICATIRAAVDKLVDRIAEQRELQRKLRDGDYIADWLPGFSTHDKRLTDAFNEGAGRTVIG